MSKTIREAADILDEMVPGWYKKINLDTLDMGENKLCILGQVYGNYYNNPINTRAKIEGWLNTLDCDASRSEWATEIVKRRTIDEGAAMVETISVQCIPKSGRPYPSPIEVNKAEYTSFVTVCKLLGIEPDLEIQTITEWDTV